MNSEMLVRSILKGIKHDFYSSRISFIISLSMVPEDKAVEEEFDCGTNIRDDMESDKSEYNEEEVDNNVKGKLDGTEDEKTIKPKVEVKLHIYLSLSLN